jgi:hypothetical protein
MSRGERMVPFKWDGGRMEEGWRESFVGITNDMAIEFLRRRVAVCEGSWFIVRGRERGEGGMEFQSLLGNMAAFCIALWVGGSLGQ